MTEEELSKLVESLNNIFSEAIKQIEDMNWFVRKSDGLLYHYKFKPSAVKDQNTIFSKLIIKPVKGDKENLFLEENNTFSFIPKNVLIHRVDLFKYKKMEEK